MTAPETIPSALTLTLFGPMQALVGGRPLPHLRSRKALSLLALLTLRHGHSVEREWVAGMLWPDSTQDQASASLRPVLSELRRALGDQAERLESPNRHTLCLQLAGADVDVIAFDAAIASKRLSALAHAVSLYRGPLLEGSAEEWIGQERTVREQDCLQALETLAGAALTSGDVGAAIDHSRRAVALDPWRDSARRQLMEALAQDGDTNSALQIYREFVQLLRSDPKALPDAQTSALYSRLRTVVRQRGATPSGQALPADHPTAPTVTGSLPHPLTDLIGREDECTEIAVRLRRSRLVTLTGPGGMGKTRLALAVASEIVREFADGAWFVALETLSDSRLVALQIAKLLGVREQPNRPMTESLTDHLRMRRLLLVLDNCEHLLQASADIAGHLLGECAGLRILATSREALGITGEVAWTVPALSVPDPEHLPTGRTTLLRVLEGYEGVRLFIERAQALQQGFTLTTDNAQAVARVCAQLGGHPLALELAAARVRSLSVAQMAARLHDHLGLLTGGRRTSPARHQTLRATLDWSAALLSMPEQILLRRLSIFGGGWRLDAAEKICVGEGIEPGRVLDLLTSLVDKSLVAFAGENAETEDRYRLLEMVRQYAAERLGAGSEAQRIRKRHRDWFLTVAEQAEAHLDGKDQRYWLRSLEREYDNLRVALKWSELPEAEEAEIRLRLVGALSRFWYLWGRYSEGLEYLVTTLEHGRSLKHPPRPALIAKALNGLGLLHYAMGSHAEARSAFEQSLELFQETGDRRGVAESLNGLGGLDQHQGNYAEAQKAFEESLRLFDAVGNRFGVARAWINLGSVEYMRGDYDAAQAVNERGLKIFRELGDERSIAWALRDQGMAARVRGNSAKARTLYEESLDIFRRLNDQLNVAHLISNLGNLAYDRADFEAASGLYEEGLAVFRQIGSKTQIAWALANLGRIAQAKGQQAYALTLYEESLRIRRELGDRDGIAITLSEMGNVSLAQGDPISAQALFTESLHLFREMGDRRGVVENLFRLPGALLVQGRAQDAVRLWGAADALRKTVHAPRHAHDQADYERRRQQAHATLGEEGFAAAWDAGRVLDWEEAAAEVLEKTSKI